MNEQLDAGVSEVPEAVPAGKATPAKKAAVKRSAARKAAGSHRTTRKAAAKKSAASAAKVGGPFPRRPLEEAVRVPVALKEQYGGNARPPDDVAQALGYQGRRSNSFFYQAAASRGFGLTSGGRDSAEIALDDRGRRYAYAERGEVERAVLKEAFLSIDTFWAVFEYYKGPGLPEKKYLSNVLEGQFSLQPEVHDEFIDLYKQNTALAGLTGSDAPAGALGPGSPPSPGLRPDVVAVDEPEGDSKGKQSFFVIMPFNEKTPEYRPGFFQEVLRSIIGPAGKQAGLAVSTANREGSDVIQSTIVNRLLDDHLVIADLTEHNPNVLFELGMRMAFDKPIILIKAKGTGPIFDVDNMLRVFEYDPALWSSTVEADVPKLAQFIRASWQNRNEEDSYLRILKRAPAGTPSVSSDA